MSSTRVNEPHDLNETDGRMNSAGAQILMLHKPKSVVVTRRDELGRKTIYDLLPRWAEAEGWVPVGRLDRDSRGLLLLVKDSHLVERLGAPGHHAKTYEVWIRGRISAVDLHRIRKGVPSPVGTLKCASASVLRTVGPRSMLCVTLEEGKNRHLRRLFGAIKDPAHGTALKVLELKRIQYGPLKLDIPSGHWRFLTPKEADSLIRPLRQDAERTGYNPPSEES